jgi:RNase P protein component
MVLKNELKLQNGKYIFVSKQDLLTKSSKEINKDFAYAMKKLNLFVK